MFRLLFVSLLTGLWQSLEVAQCQNLRTDTNISHCHNTISGKTCFTTFLTSIGRPVRTSFRGASDRCKANGPGSSLILVDDLKKKRTVDIFIGRQVLANETIFMDARKLSADESVYWSWVNGHQIVPNDVTTKAQKFHDVACVESKNVQPLTYGTGNVSELLRYICEYSNSTADFNYRQNNKSYVASVVVATWYDAREKCLRFGGDLASITDLQTIKNWTRLKENESQRYWIGLHRNKWIWNRSGAAITYTNWEGGYPDDSSNKQCICIDPTCRSDNNCGYDRKWWSCDCNNRYAIVCQEEVETSTNAVTTELVTEVLSSTSTDFKSSMFPFPYATTGSRRSTSTSSPSSSKLPATKSPSKNASKSRSSKISSTFTSTTAITTSNKTPLVTTPTTTTTSLFNPVVPTVITNITTGADNYYSSEDISSKADPATETTTQSSTTKELHTGIILPILLSVVVIFVIVAVVFIIRKRKYDKRNEAPSMGNTKQCEAVTSQYATVIPGNRPPEDTASTACPIYADVEMTQPSTPSNNTIYASVQSTSETVDMGKSVVYADLSLPAKDQQKPGSADKAAVSLSPIYSEPLVPPMSEYAEPFKPDNKSTATAPVPNHYYNIAAVGQHNV